MPNQIKKKKKKSEYQTHMCFFFFFFSLSWFLREPDTKQTLTPRKIPCPLYEYCVEIEPKPTTSLPASPNLDYFMYTELLVR